MFICSFQFPISNGVMLMLFHTSNDSFDMWVPLFIVHKRDESIPPYFVFFYLVELILLLFALFFDTLFYLTIPRTALFHRNLVGILKCFILVHIATSSSRIVMIIYQTMIPPNAFLPHDLPLIVACLVRLFFFGAVSSTIPAIIAERIFASYYSRDYEHTPRRWIPPLVLVPTVIFSLYITVSVARRKIDVVVMLSLSVTLFSLSIVAYFFMLWYNNKQMKLLRRWALQGGEMYSIGLKFQLVENIRVLKLLLFCVGVISVFFLPAVAVLGYALLTLGEGNEPAKIYFVVFDLLIAVCPVVIIVCSLRIAEWRRAVSDCASTLFGMTSSSDDVTAEPPMSISVITDTYFEAMNRAWEGPPRRKR